MSKILLIETSGPYCSVAISEHDKIIGSLEDPSVNSHSAVITILIEKLLKVSSLGFNDLDAVAVSAGPGSYTGLRIGMSTAKGICYTQKIPLISCSTLYSMANGMSEKTNGSDKTLIPMIDARRLEVYLGGFDLSLRKVIDYQPFIFGTDDLTNLVQGLDEPFFIGGSGAEKSKPYFEGFEARFLPDFQPKAVYLARQAHALYTDKNFSDLAYIEP